MTAKQEAGHSRKGRVAMGTENTEHQSVPIDDFVDRLRLISERMGSASALVRQAGISHSGFQKYLAGAEPTRKVLIALANAAGVDLQWLMTGRGTMLNHDHQEWPANSLTLLPLYRDVQPADCEIPSPVEDEKLVQLAFCREWLGKHGFDPEHLATMRVEGDSMEPTMRSGDTLVVDRSPGRIVDGELYVIRDEGGLLIKRLQRQLGGKVKLISDNLKYPQIDATVDELDIVGHIIWRGALL
jgi:phage repressor protein C with HTH and peptisase S24 domain